MLTLTNVLNITIWVRFTGLEKMLTLTFLAFRGICRRITMNNESRKYYVSLSALLFFFFFTWSSTFSIVAIWLRKYVGLEGTETGIIFSCISIVALCAQPLYGFLQDKLGLRKNLLLFIAILLISSGPFFMVFGYLERSLHHQECFFALGCFLLLRPFSTYQ